jgi:hypothetical protein
VRIGILGAIYLIVGLVVAANHHYLRHIDAWRLLLSAVLAILLWPLVLLGVNLHIHG